MKLKRISYWAGVWFIFLDNKKPQPQEAGSVWTAMRFSWKGSFFPWYTHNKQASNIFLDHNVNKKKFLAFLLRLPQYVPFLSNIQKTDVEEWKMKRDPRIVKASFFLNLSNPYWQCQVWTLLPSPNRIMIGAKVRGTKPNPRLGWSENLTWHVENIDVFKTWKC